MKKITIYTDGACSGNPGPGGWGALLMHNNTTKELSGGDPSTTNNKMELMAIIEAFKSLKEKYDIDIYTDSKYCMQGITQWIHNWKKNGWRNSQKKPVKNADLWRILDDLVNQHKTNFHWVKGHSDNPYNERCDELAREAIPY